MRLTAGGLLNKGAACCALTEEARDGRAGTAQDTVDALGLKFEALVGPGGPGPPLRPGRGRRQAGPTGGYDTARETGMAGPDYVAGVHSGVGGVFERDHGDAHCDSRARGNDAESRGHECFRGEQDAAVARAGTARGRPDLQRPTHQRGGAADADVGLADESIAAGARSTEPGAAAIADSAAGRQFAARFANRTSAGGTASGRSFRGDDDGAAGGRRGHSESETRSGSGDASGGRAGFARTAVVGLRDASSDRAE